MRWWYTMLHKMSKHLNLNTWTYSTCWFFTPSEFRSKGTLYTCFIWNLFFRHVIQWKQFLCNSSITVVQVNINMFMLIRYGFHSNSSVTCTAHVSHQLIKNVSVCIDVNFFCEEKCVSVPLVYVLSKIRTLLKLTWSCVATQKSRNYLLRFLIKNENKSE